MADETQSAQDPRTQMERQLGDILDHADKVSRTTGGGPHPARETLDRSLREIKDNVLRMGSLVEEAIRGAVDALVRHDADAALAQTGLDGQVLPARLAASAMVFAGGVQLHQMGLLAAGELGFTPKVGVAHEVTPMK